MHLKIGLLGLSDNAATPTLIHELHRLGRPVDVAFLQRPDLSTQWKRFRRKLRGAGVAATAARVMYAASVRLLPRRRPQGHSSGVLHGAKEVHVVRDFNAPECRQLVRDADLDVLLLCTDTMIGRGTFSLPRYGTLNAHPGWIPAYRGLGSILRMLEDGVAPAISVHLVDEGVDTGPLLIRETLPVAMPIDGPDAERRWLAEQARLFVAAIELIETRQARPVDTFMERSNMTRGFSASEARAIYARARTTQGSLRAMRP